MNALQISVRADFGGGPEHIYLLEKYIDKKQINIFTACPNQEPYYDKFKIYSKGMCEIPFRKFSFKTLINLAKFAKKNQIDLIHSHGKGAGVYSRLLGLIIMKPVVHTPHGLTNSGRKSLKENLYRIQEKIFSWITFRIINVSYSEQKFAGDNNIYNVKKSIVINNGIEINKFIDIEDKELLRQKHGFKKEDFIICNVSRLSREKGVIDLVEAFKYVNIPNKKLIIAGDGEEKDNLLKIIDENNMKDKIVLLGFRRDVAEIINLSNLYVSTSYGEGLPMTLLEAMACKKPIIATNVVGNNEVVIDNYNGLLCNSKDIPDIASKITDIYNSSNLDAFGNNGFELVSSKYNIESMVKKIAEVYIG